MKALIDTETLVVTLDLGNTMECVRIVKGCEVNLIVLSHEFVVVTSLTKVVDGTPFIKLAKLCKSYREAKVEFQHVIGKMCLKDRTSKYFDNPNYNEHLNNGSFPSYVTNIVIDIANTAVLKSNERMGSDNDSSIKTCW